jgi:glutamate racemase
MQIQQNDLPQLDAFKRVLGVIRPSTEEIEALTSSNHVGILGTNGTVQSESYVIELKKFAPDIQVVQHACPIWVPLIENNLHNSIPGKMLIKNDIDELIATNPKIDTIILACTHYPIVKSYLEEIVPANIQIIAQGSIVAEKLISYLERHPEIAEKCSKNSLTNYLTTENNLVFDEKASIFMQKPIASSHIKL